MSLQKPVRVSGETNVDWQSRRDSYRMDLMESQIKDLTDRIKKLEKRK